MTPSPAEREAIRARADAATPGPWSVSGVRFKWKDAASNQVLDSHLIGPDSDGIGLVFYGKPKQHTEQWANAQFLAHARTDIPALLNLIARLESEKAELRAEFKRLDDYLAGGAYLPDGTARSLIRAILAKTEQKGDSE